MINKLLLMALFGCAVSAHALTADEARSIALGETDARIEALNKAVANADDKTAAFLQALADDAVKVAGDRVFIVKDGKGIDPVTGQGADLPADAEDVVSNNRMRGELDTALGAIRLFSPDAKERAAAVKTLAAEPDASRLPLVEKALKSEQVEAIRAQLREPVSAIELAGLLPHGLDEQAGAHHHGEARDQVGALQQARYQGADADEDQPTEPQSGGAFVTPADLQPAHRGHADDQDLAQEDQHHGRGLDRGPQRHRVQGGRR